MRCWLRRWPPACCLVSGWCCTSAPPARWSRRATRCWPRRWPGTGPPRGARPRSCRPGWRRPGRPSGCSVTPRRRCTGSGPSSCATRCPMPGRAGASTCRECTCGPSMRSRCLAMACAPVWWPRRHTAGSPITPTTPPPRSSTSAPRITGRSMGPPPGLPLIKEALRLFERAPPSADHAEAWLDYATLFLFHVEGRQQASLTALNRALEIAESAGATVMISRILPRLASTRSVRGQVEEGFAMLQRGRALAEASGNDVTLLWLAVIESDALLKRGSSRALPTWHCTAFGPLARPAWRPGFRRPSWPPTQPRRCSPAGARPTRRR